MCVRGNDVERNEKFHVRKIDHIDINHIERVWEEKDSERGKLHKLDDGQVMYCAHILVSKVKLISLIKQIYYSQ